MYYEDTAEHLMHEIELLRRFAERDEKQTNAIIQEHVENDANVLNKLLRCAMDIVDAEASLKFSLYLDDAKINGYSFQAYLVEKKAMPARKWGQIFILDKRTHK
jgi:hypothetical protein